MNNGSSDIYHIFYFDNFALDLDRCQLSRNDIEVPLRLQSFEVLRFLVERSGHLVTKKELLQNIWAGRAVTDDSISQCLMEIRAALDDTHHTKVKTLPRRGYLFDLPVSDSKPGFNFTTIRDFVVNNKKSGIALILAGFALVLTIGGLILRPGLSPSLSDQVITVEPVTETTSDNGKSVAVLPFVDMSHNQDQGYFADGIHDNLLATIAKIGSIKVISRTSVMEYRDTTKKIPQIAQELGVANIIEGGIQRSGNQVRINVQLIDAETDEHLWAEIYDRELTAENLFNVQSEVTRMIADALQAELSTDEQLRIDARPTDNLQAYEAYMRGRQLLATRTTTSMKLAVEEFNKATEIDPLFALAWVGVADSNLLLLSWDGDRAEDLLPIVEDALRNALAIDNGLGEAYSAQAWVHNRYGRIDEAEVAHQKAIELSPNYASAYQWYSNFIHSDPLRIQESIDLMRIAANLDPNSAIIGLQLGSTYNIKGLYELAEGQFKKVIKHNPDFATGYNYLSSLYRYQMGQFDKALPLIDKAITLDRENYYYYLFQGGIYMQLGDLEAVQEVRGKMADSGAKEWMLSFVDVHILFGKENPTGTRETINRLLPKMQYAYGARLKLGLIALAQGDIQLAREIYLSVEPRWLEPEYWPVAIESNRNNFEGYESGCIVAWLLMNTGDQELGEALLQQATDYIEDSLPLMNAHPDQFFPDTCYLTAGDTGKALLSIETRLAHNHLNGWDIAHRMPMYDLIHNEPRYQAAWTERERRLKVQRDSIEIMAIEAQP